MSPRDTPVCLLGYHAPVATSRRASPLDETLNETRERPSARGESGRQVPALVLIWSRDEPDRIGEAVHLPPGAESFTIGRAVAVDDDGAIPLTFGQLRPSGRVDTGALVAAHVSRRQLALAALGDGRLRVELTGRGALRLDGHEMKGGVIGPGGLIEVENRFALLYTWRPLEWTRARADGERERFPFGGVDPFGIVGESPAAWELRQQAAFLAGRDEHVLVIGPSGSGKELIVASIHGLSRRSGAALVARNAATIPETLIDAELFGNLRNYPNPGMPERAGILGDADGGTFFLDEIGELPLALQAHLLRVMDRGEYQRLGESRVRRADVRIVAATNREPGDLKHDLLARFTHRLRVPGLGERREDVVLIARALLRTIAEGAGERPRELGSEMVAALVGHAYTTHVRELHELLWRALRAGGVDEATGALASPPDLARSELPRPDEGESGAVPSSLSRDAVVAVLERCGGVKEVAWRELGLRNRFQLHRLLRRLGIE